MGTSAQSNTQTSTNNNTNGTTTTAPSWQPQASDLTNAFDQANGALTQAQGYTAPVGVSSSSLLPSTNAVGANGGALSTNGANATATGLTQLTGYNPSATNNPSAIITAAQQYMAGQDIPDQVKAAMQQATQTANQSTLPGITQNANATGNADSSRAGIANGMVQESLANQSAALNGALSGQAYSNGLTLAENQANANNTAALTAATNAASAGTNAANAGTNAVTGAVTNTGNINANNNTNYTNSVADAYDPLAAYMALIGGQNWGSTTTGNATTTGTGTSNTETTPSALQVITGLMGGAGSLMTGYGNL